MIIDPDSLFEGCLTVSQGELQLLPFEDQLSDSIVSFSLALVVPSLMVFELANHFIDIDLFVL